MQSTFLILLSVIVLEVRAQSSLRFYGSGVLAPDQDRVKIQIDDPTNTNPGPPADIGSENFTIEFWMKALAADNSSNVVTCGENVNWINGNIILDRDRFNQDRKFGLSVAGGFLVFGVSGDQTGDRTICSATSVLDNLWHHVVVQRRRSDGYLWMYLDGILESSIDGPDGDISYPDNGTPCSHCCGGNTCNFSDPYLVLGAEKHDAGAAYPSYNGHLDELRLSNTLRYSANFTPATQPFSTDAQTVALYHFDEGYGNTLQDYSEAEGGPSSGQIHYGGDPSGPIWSTETPFDCLSSNNDWIGDEMANWHDDPDNWSLQRVPYKCDFVTISQSNQVGVTSSNVAEAYTLEISLGASLMVDAGAMMVIGSFFGL